MSKVNEKWLMNLQLFAEDDDPTVEDEDMAELRSLLEAGAEPDEDELDDEGESDDEPDEDSGDEPDDEPEPEEEPEGEKPPEKVFTQEEVNRIVGQARIQGRDVMPYIQQLQELTGMELKDIVESVRANVVRSRADEKGITEDEARAEIEKDQRLQLLEKQVQQQSVTQKVLQYESQKAQHANDVYAPYARKYEKEIDSFAMAGAQSGHVLDYPTARSYILGQHMTEILADIKKGTEQKTLSNVGKREKTAVETGSQPGKSDKATLSKEERQLAAAFGYTPDSLKDVKAKKEQIKKERRK